MRALSRTFICQVENLSVGGVFVRTDQLLPCGTTLELDLVKPGARKALHLTGTVVWAVDPERAADRSCPPGIGIQFAHPPAEQAERLYALLAAAGVRPEGTVASSTAHEDALAELVSLHTPTSGGALAQEPDSFAESAERERPAIPSGVDYPSAALAPQETGTEAGRLMVQIRGLIFELGELRGQLEQREAQLQEALAQLQSARDRIELLERERSTKPRANKS